MRPVRLSTVVALAVVIAGCSGDDGDAGGSPDAVINEERCLDADEAAAPQLDLLFDAVEVVEGHYGSEQRYYEISVDRQRVSLIVADDDTGNAAQSFYCGDAGFGLPEPLGEAAGATFVADDLDLDPDRVLSGVQDELDDPAILDFVVQAAPDGVLYDATVQSDAGGVLLVLLSPTGEVLAVQAT